MIVTKVEKIRLDKPVPVYDILNVERFNNFIIRGNDKDYVAHNCAILDEINFGAGPKDANMAKNAVMKLYNSVKQRMKSRFITSARPLPTMLFMVSSKKTELDFLDKYKDSVKNEPDVLVVDEPIWKVKPSTTYSGKMFKVAVGDKYKQSRLLESPEEEPALLKQGYTLMEVPIEYESDFKKDIDSALMNIAGISILAKMKFLSGPRLQECLIDKENPFTTEILVIGTQDELQIKDFFREELISEEDKNKPGFIHIDTSVSGDKTGISYVIIDGAKKTSIEVDDETESSTELYYRQVFGVDIKAPAGDQIDFEKTRQFIYYLRNRGFNIKSVSTDGFQSVDTQQRLKKKHFDAQLLSLDKKPDGYIILKASVIEHRIGLLPIKLMLEEMTLLERDNTTGKVDHPVDGSKDLSDSLAGSLWNASLYKDEYLYTYGEDMEIAVDVNADSIQGKSEVIRQLSEMLKQDPAKAKQDAKKVVNYANERRPLKDVTNMTSEEIAASNKEDARRNGTVFTPTVLDDNILIF